MPMKVVGNAGKKKTKTTAISVGYERRSVDELLKILFQHGVRKLLDVREAPISRRKGFSKTALSLRLRQAGIQYRHLRPAGNPHRKEKEDVERCLGLYATYLHRNPGVVDLVTTELSGGPIAMLCYERRHDDCHRSVLIEAIDRSGHPLRVVRIE